MRWQDIFNELYDRIWDPNKPEWVTITAAAFVDKNGECISDDEYIIKKIIE